MACVRFGALLAVASVVAAIASCSSGDDSSPGGAGGGSAGTSGKAGASSGSAGSGVAGSANGGTTNAGGAGANAGRPGTAGSDSGGSSTGGSSAGGSSAGATNQGVAGAEGGEAGASNPPPPDCDDHNNQTVDFYKPAYGCGHLLDSNPNDGESWINYDAGFSVDPKTSTAWEDADFQSFVTQDQARTKCEALHIGSLGFRLPTIDDARSLAYNCPATISGGSCPIHDPTCLTQTCGGYGAGQAQCTSCLGDGVNYVNPDSNLNDVIFHTSSMCSDATPPNTEWQYFIFNGNFALQDPNGMAAAVCVISNLPDALP
ncbi:MAG TPA: hypothetical protein VGM44_00880 [Polyangiaceae bacterium]|jgi:hypothetical protein